MTVTTMPKPVVKLPASTQATAMMRALVHRGPGKKALEDRPKPVITDPTDAIVRITRTTICGTDLHILKGDVPTCELGRIRSPSLSVRRLAGALNEAPGH